ncbi:MAG: hypothetical protein WA849_12080 [Candidatus Udaeobacter sp.]
MYWQFRDLNHGRVNGWEMETACPQAVFRFICRFDGVRARRLQLQFAGLTVAPADIEILSDYLPVLVERVVLNALAKQRSSAA